MTSTASCPAHADAQVSGCAAEAEPFDMHAPDSLSIRFYGDVRGWLMSGRTFLMQVAHPAVGAGVWEHSTFRQDPWHRLREIDRSGRNFVLSGKEASLAEGARLRKLHRNIKGVDSRGRPYHSLEPHVYGWVHTVFLDSTVTMNALYGTPLTRAEQEQLFVEWRQGGRVFGLRDRDMPATLDDYWAHYEHMIETELECNAVVDHILTSGVPAEPPALRYMPRWLWRALSGPLGAASRKLILSSLPPSYRKKIADRHPWTDADERGMERFRRIVRATVPHLPAKLRYRAAARRAMCPV
jgi:uncharacterized protein (DUF2236 family)